MADIGYTPGFKHANWTDGESVVQAGGPDGFNGRFHDIEDEFSSIASAFEVVDETVKKAQALRFLEAGQTVNLGPDASKEVDIETYDKAGWPDQRLDKVYFCLITPTAAEMKPAVTQTFLYRNTATATQRRVTLVLHNPHPTANVAFNYRILSLGGA